MHRTAPSVRVWVSALRFVGFVDCPGSHLLETRRGLRRPLHRTAGVVPEIRCGRTKPLTSKDAAPASFLCKIRTPEVFNGCCAVGPTVNPRYPSPKRRRGGEKRFVGSSATCLSAAAPHLMRSLRIAGGRGIALAATAAGGRHAAHAVFCSTLQAVCGLERSRGRILEYPPARPNRGPSSCDL